MTATAQQTLDHGNALIAEFHPGYSEVNQGGLGPNWYDCSGWVMTLLEWAGIPVGRNTTAEFLASPAIRHSATPQFMCLGWLQVPGDPNSIHGIPDHVFFWLNQTTCLEAPHTGEAVGTYPIPPNSPDEYLIGYGIVPYASASPAPPPPSLWKGVSMQATDPDTGGVWCLDPTNGSIWSYGVNGSPTPPYLGGFNIHPDWNVNCANISGISAFGNPGQHGYVISVRTPVGFDRYAFTRDGKYAHPS